MNYKCDTCDRIFEYSSELQSHVLCCEFFYKKHKIRLSKNTNVETENVAETDTVDRIPFTMAITVQSLYDLVIRQGKEIELLKKDVINLKNNQNTRIARVVKARLIEEENSININFNDWVKTIEVSFDHLEEVFKYSKVDGIKQCIKDAVDNCKQGNCPIKSCSEKTASIYIYTLLKPKLKSNKKKDSIEAAAAETIIGTLENTDKYGWVRMTIENVHFMVLQITRGLMMRHLEYQTENKHKIDTDEKEREKSFLCIKKLNNMIVSLDKQKAEIKKWLISYIISS